MIRIALIAIIVLCFFICAYSLLRYVKTRHVKEGGKRMNPWLIRSIISFAVSVLAGVGLYTLRKDGDKHADTS